MSIWHNYFHTNKYVNEKLNFFNFNINKRTKEHNTIKILDNT